MRKKPEARELYIADISPVFQFFFVLPIDKRENLWYNPIPQ